MVSNWVGAATIAAAGRGNWQNRVFIWDFNHLRPAAPAQQPIGNDGMCGATRASLVAKSIPEATQRQLKEEAARDSPGAELLKGLLAVIAAAGDGGAEGGRVYGGAGHHQGRRADGSGAQGAGAASSSAKEGVGLHGEGARERRGSAVMSWLGGVGRFEQERMELGLGRSVFFSLLRDDAVTVAGVVRLMQRMLRPGGLLLNVTKPHWIGPPWVSCVLISDSARTGRGADVGIMGALRRGSECQLSGKHSTLTTSMDKAAQC